MDPGSLMMMQHQQHQQHQANEAFQHAWNQYYAASAAAAAAVAAAANYSSSFPPPPPPPPSSAFQNHHTLLSANSAGSTTSTASALSATSSTANGGAGVSSGAPIASLFSPPKAPRKWSPEEDDLLRQTVERIGCKKWKVVAQHVPGRNSIQCLQRWNKVLKPGIKKGPWTEEEDELVRKTVAQLTESVGGVNWAVVALAVPGRTAKQCRERWRCNLDPSIVKADWTKDEDEMLLALQRELGNRWALISKSLPGRTENAIKTRFRSYLRAENKKWSAEEDALVREYMDGTVELASVATRMPKRSMSSIKKRAVALKASRVVAAAASASSSSSSSSSLYSSSSLGAAGPATAPAQAALDENRKRQAVSDDDDADEDMDADAETDEDGDEEGDDHNDEDEG